MQNYYINSIILLQEKINSACLSQKSDYLAISTGVTTKAYSINTKQNMELNRISKIKFKAKYMFSFTFNKEEYLLLINNTNIYLATLDNTKVLIDSELPNQKIILDAEFNIEKHHLAISYINCKVYVFYLENILKLNSKVETKITAKHSINYTNYITKLKFINKGEDLLLVSSINEVMKYNSTNGITSICDSQNSKELFKKYAPNNLISWYNKIQDIVEIRDNFYIAYTDYNFIPIYSDVKMPEKSLVFRDISSRIKNKKDAFVLRKYHEKILSNVVLNNKVDHINEDKVDSEVLNFSIFTKFNSNVYMKYLNDNLIVLELDWEKILSKMIKPIVVKRLNN